jgi:hypothetical protein
MSWFAISFAISAFAFWKCLADFESLQLNGNVYQIGTMPITRSAQPFYVQQWFSGAPLPCSAAIAAENASEKRRRFLAVPYAAFQYFEGCS